MSYPISDLNGLDEDMAAELRAIGIRTTEKLLNAAKDPKGRKKLAQRTGFDEKLILRWAPWASSIAGRVPKTFPSVAVSTIFPTPRNRDSNGNARRPKGAKNELSVRRRGGRRS